MPFTFVFPDGEEVGSAVEQLAMINPARWLFVSSL